MHRRRSITTCILATSLMSSPRNAPADELTMMPDRSALIQTIRRLHEAVTRGDITEASTLVIAPPALTPDRLRRDLTTAMTREVSPAGIDILEAKGTFGPLTEVFPIRGARKAERAGVSPSDCYALRLEQAELMGHWNGEQFRLFRMDDIADLTGDL